VGVELVLDVDDVATSAHANFATTQQIYARVDEAARLDALTRLNKLLGGEG
jgi:hypothetical protein